MANKCCPERVGVLIANEATPYIETDREWLESLTEEQLTKIEVMSEPQLIEREVEPMTLEEYLETASEDIKSRVNAGLQELENKRNTMIQIVLANKKNTFAEEDLQKLETKVLEGLASIATAEVTTPVQAPVYVGNNSNDPVEPITKIEAYVTPTLGKIN